MNESKKKLNVDFYKFLFFPDGLLVVTISLIGIVTTSLFSNGIEEFTKYWKVYLIAFVAVELCSFIAIYLHANHLPKGKKNRFNVYVLIYPESTSDDRYIKEDFTPTFQKHVTELVENANVVLPNVVKRHAFYNKSKQNGYWQSRCWHKYHNRLHGDMYVTGELKRRNSGGSSKLMFDLTVVIGYQGLNMSLLPMLNYAINSDAPRQVAIDCRFEMEQIGEFSEKFARVADYLLGGALTISGDFVTAFKIHAKIYQDRVINNSMKGFFDEIEKYIKIELSVILGRCRDYPIDIVDYCILFAYEHFGHDDTAPLMCANGLIIKATSETFSQRLKRAHDMLAKAKITSKNRAAMHASRAYLYLLMNEYGKADREYELMFKKNDSNVKKVVKGVIDYCEKQILICAPEEKNAAYYVRTFMLYKDKSDLEALRIAREDAMKNISESETYYTEKLNSMNISNPR